MEKNVNSNGYVLTNCIEDGKGILGEKSFRAVCPKCGNKSSNRFCVSGSNDYANSAFCFSCGTEYNVAVKVGRVAQTRNTKPSNSIIVYSEKKTLTVNRSGWTLPVPNGYRGSQSGEGNNRDWVYIVPKTSFVASDHINARPIGIGVAKKISLPKITLPDAATLGTTYSQMIRSFLSQMGVFGRGPIVNELSKGENQVAFYQFFYNDEQFNWNKACGYLCAGNDIRMFHIYMNHDKPIAHLEDTYKMFRNIVEEWLNKVVFESDIKSANRVDKLELMKADSNDSNSFPIGKVPENCKELLFQLEKQKNIDYVVRAIPKIDFLNEQSREIAWAGYQYWFHHSDHYTLVGELFKIAEKYMPLFRDDSKEIDRESEIRLGLINDISVIHSFRSFVWTLDEYCSANGIAYSDIGYEKYLDLGNFIYEHGFANWEPVSKKTGKLCAALLPRSEVDSGSDSVGVGGNQVCLKDAISALISIKVPMDLVFEHLKGKEKVLFSNSEKVLNDVLACWCFYAFACVIPFGVYKRKRNIDFQKCHQNKLPELIPEVIDGDSILINDILVGYCGTTGNFTISDKVNAFNIDYKQYNLGRLVFPKSLKYYEKLFISTNSREIVIDCNVGDLFFSSFDKYEMITVNGNVNKLTLGGNDLRKVNLNGSVEKLDIDCVPQLSMITIPESVKEISYHGSRTNPLEITVFKGSIAEDLIKSIIAKDYQNKLRLKVEISPAEKARKEAEKALIEKKKQIRSSMCSLPVREAVELVKISDFLSDSESVAFLQENLEEFSLKMDEKAPSSGNIHTYNSKSTKTEIKVLFENNFDERSWHYITKEKRIPIFKSNNLNNLIAETENIQDYENVITTVVEKIDKYYTNILMDIVDKEKFKKLRESLEDINKQSIKPLFEANMSRIDVEAKFRNETNVLLSENTWFLAAVSRTNVVEACTVVKNNFVREFGSIPEVIAEPGSM